MFKSIISAIMNKVSHILFNFKFCLFEFPVEFVTAPYVSAWSVGHPTLEVFCKVDRE